MLHTEELSAGARGEASEGAGMHPDDLQQVLREIQDLLAEWRPVSAGDGAETPALMRPVPERDILLRGRLDALHPADIAYILEALPLTERLLVWDLVKAERDGEILLEVSDAVR